MKKIENTRQIRRKRGTFTYRSTKNLDKRTLKVTLEEKVKK